MYMNKKECSVRNLLVTVRSANICEIGIMERGNNEEENIFEEIMADGFPKLMKDINTQIQEVQQYKTKKTTPWHIIFKQLKIKEKILKALREKGHNILEGANRRH